jgi:hypothetical protein
MRDPSPPVAELSRRPAMASLAMMSIHLASNIRQLNFGFEPDASGR